MEALEQAISLGFNTILTSGQNNCVDGSPLLAELVEKRVVVFTLWLVQE